MSPSKETIQPDPLVGTELVRHWTSDTHLPLGRVVVIHGIGEHSGRYERVGTQLAAAGFETTAFDLIGHGATGGRRVHVDNWADFLDQVERHVTSVMDHGDPVILMGHSMGGLIAAEYVLSDRPSPDLLVLCAPALSGGAGWQVKMAPFLSAVAPHVAVPSLIRGEQLSTDPAVGEAYFEDPLVVTSATIRLGAEMFSAMQRVRERAHSIEIPTLTLHGSDDTVVPCQTSAGIGISGDRIVYPGLRHELFNHPEGPRIVEEVVTWVRDHLDLDAAIDPDQT
ncbi:MAG: alpha/beta fold hydrolase [Acidimicrobiia bacterium]|nr:alpha/beta fold hydrolase [Acidimicrobiia bacterium]